MNNQFSIPSKLKALRAFLPLGVLFLLPHTSHADTLAEYEFDLNSPASTDGDLLTSAANLVFGPFLTQNGTGPTFSSEQARVNTGNTGLSGVDGDTLAEALTNGAYISFTLNTGGNAVSLTELTFDHGFINGLNTTSHIAVFNSIQGFAEGNQLTTFTFTTITGDTSAARNVPLSGIPLLQNFTSDVEWRLYFFDNSDTGARITTIDNVVLTGTAVPEPSGATLLALGLTGLFIRRRGR